jgi:hypothetical protein
VNGRPLERVIESTHLDSSVRSIAEIPSDETLGAHPPAMDNEQEATSEVPTDKRKSTKQRR